MKSKGFTQIDYIIAAGMFIVVFALIVQFTLSYFSTTADAAQALDLNSAGRSLLSAADNVFVPDGWPEINPSTETGLVLLMHFNNESRFGESRTFFKDFSGLGNNGACSGAACPYYNQSGKLGGAMAFDGVNDYVDTGNSQSLNLTIGTVILWFKPITAFSGNTGRQQHLMEGGPKEFYFSASSSKLFYFLPDDSTGVGSDSGTWDTNWHNVAATSNGTILKMYIDGVLQANTVNTGGQNFFAFTSNVRIGKSSIPFNGTIDEVAIYNRSLSASEVLNHYNYGLRLRRIGLKTTAYRFLVLVNNTNPYYYNSSMSAISLTNELISFNYTMLGFPKIDYKSTVIYDENNSAVAYQISGDNITFRTNLNANQSKFFTIYFDDDSAFEDRSEAITGNNNISEIIYPIEKIELLQYRKLINLNNSNYTADKNMSAVNNDFRIRIYDTNTSSYFMTFGGDLPRSGNVVAFQRFLLFQNSTAGIRNGKMIVQVW